MCFPESFSEVDCKHVGVDSADIKQDPVFRAQFHKMCANVGVDPLASNKVRMISLVFASTQHRAL